VDRESQSDETQVFLARGAILHDRAAADSGVVKSCLLAALLISASAGSLQSPALTSILNIRDQGATGSGTDDDTAAVVAAFSTACASGGGTIYVPAGTYIINPAVAAIPICSNLVVTGSGTLKVKPDAGNYRHIFAATPLAAAVNNLTFTGITVDQNAARNTTARIEVGDLRTEQLVWEIQAGTNLHFENMQLHFSGVDPLDVNGPTVSGIYVAHNYIVFEKRAGQPEFDNSSIYIDGEDFHVTDNTFVSSAADQARTAIEVHSGSGSIVGNTIDGFSVGMNLVNVKSSSVTGNTVRNAGYGISLWSTTTMDAVAVSGNTISIAQVTRRTPSAWGIAAVHDAGFNGRFVHLQISGNVVAFEREFSPRAVDGSANYGIGLQTLGNISDAIIVGNEITRAPVRGIAVGILDARYTTSGVSIRDNHIVDAGSNFSRDIWNYSAAIGLQGNLSSIDVLGNRVDFFSSPYTGHYSYWSFENGYAFRGVVVTGNHTTAVDGSPENGLTDSVIRTMPPD
jgi:Pectate lyase superfamily protein